MLRYVIRAAAAGALFSACAMSALAAPVGGLAGELKAKVGEGNGIEKAAYRCWYRHGVRHCREYRYYRYYRYYDDDAYYGYQPYYGYGPGFGLYFGGGGGHFGGHHFHHRHW